MLGGSFFEFNSASKMPILLLGEHAGYSIPRKYNHMGVNPNIYRSDPNFAGDKGIRRILFHLSRELNIPVLIGKYSRLLIDLNRSLDHPELICSLQHGVDVPANMMLNNEEKENRIGLYYTPFHSRLAERILELKEAGRRPALLSVHSYSPDVALGKIGKESMARDAVDVGLLYSKESFLLNEFEDYFKSNLNHSFAHNYPYDLKKLRTGSVDKYCCDLDVDGLALEINRNNLEGYVAQTYWADVIANVLRQFIG